MTWYVVFRGWKPGVYSDWQSCNEHFCGFSNNCYRGYATRDEALASYRAYLGKGYDVRTQYLGQSDDYAGGPSEAKQGSVPATAAAQARTDGAAPPAAADPDIASLLLVLLALLVAIVGYIMH